MDPLEHEHAVPAKAAEIPLWLRAVVWIGAIVAWIGTAHAFLTNAEWRLLSLLSSVPAVPAVAYFGRRTYPK